MFQIFFDFPSISDFPPTFFFFILHFSLSPPAAAPAQRSREQDACRRRPDAVSHTQPARRTSAMLAARAFFDRRFSSFRFVTPVSLLSTPRELMKHAKERPLSRCDAHAVFAHAIFVFLSCRFCRSSPLFSFATLLKRDISPFTPRCLRHYLKSACSKTFF